MSAPIMVNNYQRNRNGCLIDAISEMEQMSAGEKMGAALDDDFFTLSMKIEYFTIGFKAFLSGKVVIFILLPLAVAVSMGQIPAFGENATLFHKIYLFILAFSVYSGGLFLILTTPKYVRGEYTKAIAQNLFLGAGMAAVVKGVGLSIAYQVIQAVVSPATVMKILQTIRPNMNIYTIYGVLESYRPVFRISAMVIIIYSVLSIAIIVFSYYRACKNLKKQQRIRSEYFNK